MRTWPQDGDPSQQRPRHGWALLADRPSWSVSPTTYDADTFGDKGRGRFDKFSNAVELCPVEFGSIARYPDTSKYLFRAVEDRSRNTDDSWIEFSDAGNHARAPNLSELRSE